MNESGKVRVGVVGLGYWGPNIARNFENLPEAELAWLCDRDEKLGAKQQPNFPNSKFTTELADLLGDDSLDAIAIATNVPTHAAIALQAIDAGKHCFVEKPLAGTLADAASVAAAADDAGVKLMVGHLLEYHPGILKIRELIDSGDLGELRYLYSNRLNLGKIRSDENALWSLGAHDVAVLLSLVGEEPSELWARGECYMQPGIEDVVFGYMRFPSGLAAHMHLSWLDPHKERRLTVVGSKRMATFDDMRIESKLTVYDKGFDQSFESYGEYIARAGDVWSPSLSNDEPLRVECRHFVECVRDDLTPRTDGHAGVRVVRVLDALQQSLEATRAQPPVDGTVSEIVEAADAAGV